MKPKQPDIYEEVKRYLSLLEDPKDYYAREAFIYALRRRYNLLAVLDIRQPRKRLKLPFNILITLPWS